MLSVTDQVLNDINFSCVGHTNECSIVPRQGHFSYVSEIRAGDLTIYCCDKVAAGDLTSLAALNAKTHNNHSRPHGLTESCLAFYGIELPVHVIICDRNIPTPLAFAGGRHYPNNRADQRRVGG